MRKSNLRSSQTGTLADATGMSKSGLFAHFGSREELLLAVLAHGQAEFTEVVFQPAMAKARGLPRLRAMFANWMKLTSVEIDSGCIYISGAVEFDDRPGPVRDRLERAGLVELIGRGHFFGSVTEAVASTRSIPHETRDIGPGSVFSLA